MKLELGVVDCPFLKTDQKFQEPNGLKSRQYGWTTICSPHLETRVQRFTMVFEQTLRFSQCQGLQHSFDTF